MQLTRFTDLGLRAITLLGSASEPLTTTHIATLINAPYHHVAKVMARLVELDIVASQRGPGGGMTLSDSVNRRSVGEVARELEGNGEVIACELPQPCPLCSDCELRRALARARDAFFSELDGLMISTLIQQTRPRWVAIRTPAFSKAIDEDLP